MTENERFGLVFGKTGSINSGTDKKNKRGKTSLCLPRNQVRSSFGDWLNGILELSASLEEMELDVSAFACLAALSLLHGKSCFSFLSWPMAPS
jgi:hypothetical protein